MAEIRAAVVPGATHLLDLFVDERGAPQRGNYGHWKYVYIRGALPGTFDSMRPTTVLFEEYIGNIDVRNTGPRSYAFVVREEAKVELKKLLQDQARRIREGSIERLTAMVSKFREDGKLPPSVIKAVKTRIARATASDDLGGLMVCPISEIAAAAMTKRVLMNLAENRSAPVISRRRVAETL